ncbi:Synaptic vesicle 2-related protein [Balamuthia mandrillaris]
MKGAANKTQNDADQEDSQHPFERITAGTALQQNNENNDTVSPAATAVTEDEEDWESSPQLQTRKTHLPNKLTKTKVLKGSRLLLSSSSASPPLSAASPSQSRGKGWQKLLDDDTPATATKGLKAKEDEEEEDVQEASSETTYSCEEAINKLGFGWFQWQVLLLCGAAFTGEAMEVMLVSFMMGEIEAEWGLSSWERASLGACVFLGMLLGSYIFGYLADKKGRRFAFFLVVCVTGFFGIVSAFAPTSRFFGFSWLLLARGAVGVGVGGLHVCFSLFLEFLPASARGPFIILIEFFWSVGALLEAGMAWIILPHLNWRFLLAATAAPCFIVLICFRFLPESPRFYIISGERKKAIAVLQRVASANKKKLPEGQLEEKELHERGQFKDLVSPALRNTTFLLWLIWFTSSFVYYGIVLMTPDYFGEGEDNDVYLPILITTLAELPGLFLTAYLVNKVGRKKTLALTFLICAVCTFFLFPRLHIALSTTFAVGSRASIYGAFAAAYVYTSEVYPTTLRGIGLGSATAVARAGGVATPFVVEVLSEMVGRAAPLLIFACFSGMSAVASMILSVETANRELADSLSSTDEASEELELIPMREVDLEKGGMEQRKKRKSKQGGLLNNDDDEEVEEEPMEKVHEGDGEGDPEQGPRKKVAVVAGRKDKTRGNAEASSAASGNITVRGKTKRMLKRSANEEDVNEDDDDRTLLTNEAEEER